MRTHIKIMAPSTPKSPTNYLNFFYLVCVTLGLPPLWAQPSNLINPVLCSNISSVWHSIGWVAWNMRLDFEGSKISSKCGIFSPFLKNWQLCRCAFCNWVLLSWSGGSSAAIGFQGIIFYMNMYVYIQLSPYTKAVWPGLFILCVLI